MIEQEQLLQDGRHFIGGREVTDREPRGQSEQPRLQLLIQQQQRTALTPQPLRPASPPDQSCIPPGIKEP